MAVSRAEPPVEQVQLIKFRYIRGFFHSSFIDFLRIDFFLF